MHDPMVVAFTIVRPWPSRSQFNDAKKPGDPRWAMRLHHTCGSWCKGCGKAGHASFPWWRLRSYSRFWTMAGRGFYWPALVTVWHHEPGGRDSGEVCARHERWRWHVHHWRIQIPPLQEARRRLLTRCEWCGGRSKRRDAVNHSHSWDRAKQPWWRSERGLYHGDCSTVQTAHQTCTCPDPLLRHAGYGTCSLCGRSRGYGAKTEWLERAERIRNAVPAGSRDKPAFAAAVA